jgi:transglutaminase-like putative cysteine protease
MTLGRNLPSEEFTDSHGNPYHRVVLEPGTNCIRHDAIVAVPSKPDNYDLGTRGARPDRHPPSDPSLHAAQPVLRLGQADQLRLGEIRQVEHGWPRVQAISKWLHENIEYRYMSGRRTSRPGTSCSAATESAATSRTSRSPSTAPSTCPPATSPATCPTSAFPDPDGHMDFHAYAEVYLGGEWFTTDARFHVPRIGRIKVACGQDAVDGAFSTIFGGRTSPISRSGPTRYPAERWGRRPARPFGAPRQHSGPCRGTPHYRAGSVAHLNGVSDDEHSLWRFR